MFKFQVAKLGYQVQIPGSPSTFLVACGYWATTKSYTATYRDQSHFKVTQDIRALSLKSILISFLIWELSFIFNIVW